MKTYLKKLILFSTLFLFTTITFAQITFSLRIVDNQGKAMPNTVVTFIETQTKEKITATTNAAGSVTQLFDHGRFWRFDVLEIKDYYDWQIEVPQGQTGTASRTITYDYQRYLRVSRPPIDRSRLQIVKVTQNYKSNEKASATEGIIRVEIKKSNRQPLTNFPVSITCYALNKTFTNFTDQQGVATFKVPINNEFQVDIDGIDNYDYVDLPNRPNFTAITGIIYEPTTVNETVKNDTIIQQLTAKDKSSSARVMSTLTITNGENGTPANTTVYLQAVKTKKVYVGQADNEGKVRFLLPKGDGYMINFRYQKNVDVLNLTRHRGIGYSHKTLGYYPQERLQFPERFIPTPDQLYLTEFQHFFKKQYPKPQIGEGLLTHAKFCGKVNEKSTQALLQLGFSAEPASKDRGGDDLNIAFVVDKSGSMFGQNMDNLKVALTKFVEQLRENDMVSLTSFESQGELLLPHQKISKNKKDVLDKISLLEADGGTDIWAGLEIGYKELQKGYRKGKTNRLILLSDGYGADNPVETIKKSKAFNDKGLELSAVGVGEYYNVALMTKLASQGGGLLELTKNSEAIQRIFLDELNSLITPIAEDVKVEVLFNKNLLFAQIFGFPLEEKRDGKVVLKLKKIYAGMSDQLGLVKFTLVNPTQAIENEPITIITKYYDLQTKQNVKKETQVKLSWSPVTGEIEYITEREDKKLYGVAVMNWSLKNMAEAFAAKDYKKAKETLAQTTTEIKKLFPNSTDEDLNKLLKEMETYAISLDNFLVNLQQKK